MQNKTAELNIWKKDNRVYYNFPATVIIFDWVCECLASFLMIRCVTFLFIVFCLVVGRIHTSFFAFAWLSHCGNAICLGKEHLQKNVHVVQCSFATSYVLFRQTSKQYKGEWNSIAQKQRSFSSIWTVSGKIVSFHITDFSMTLAFSNILIFPV